MKKTIKDNWRVEIHLPSLISDSPEEEDRVRREIRESTTQLLVDGRCPKVPKGIEIKCDEKEICSACGKPWKPVAYYYGELWAKCYFCRHCNAPEKSDEGLPIVLRNLDFDVIGDRAVSTTVVRCSAAINPPLVQYETIIWEWDGKQRSEMLDRIFHMSEQRARAAHRHIVDNLTQVKEERQAKKGKEA